MPNNKHADELYEAIQGSNDNIPAPEPSENNSTLSASDQLYNAVQSTPDATEEKPNPERSIEDERKYIGESFRKGTAQGFKNVISSTYPLFLKGAELAGVDPETVSMARNSLMQPKRNYQAQYGNNPYASSGETGGEILGTLPALTLGGEAISAIPGVGGFLAGTGGSNLLTKGISAASGGALSGAGFNALTGRDPVQGAEIGAALGPIGRAVGSMIMPAAEETAAVTSGDVKDLGSKMYKELAKEGAVTNPEFTDKMIGYVEAQKPASALGLATGKSDPSLELSKVLQDFKGKPLDFQSIQEFDENLSNQITNAMKDGRHTPESNKLSDIQQGIRNLVNKAGPEDMLTGTPEGFQKLAQARKIWSQYIKMRDIENIEFRASYAKQPASAAQTMYKNLLTNAKKTRGYSADELDLLKKAAKTGSAVDMLNIIGSRLIPMVSGAAGGFPGAAIGYASSAAARNVAEKMQSAKAQALLNKMANNAKGSNALMPKTESISSPYINKLIQTVFPAIGAQSLSTPQGTP